VRLLRQLLRGRCCPGRRGEWWLRLSLDLAHLGRQAEALQVAEAALTDPWVRHGDRVALQRRLVRLLGRQQQLQRKKGGQGGQRGKRGGLQLPAWATQPEAAAALSDPPEVVVSATMLPGTTGLKSRFLAPANGCGAPSAALPATAPTSAPTSAALPTTLPATLPVPLPAPIGMEVVGVEELAVRHYGSAAGGGWRGVHSEGGVWGTLWGLLMWDVVFMEVPE
ncbi:hypothetical protein Agub_g7330, partial [Astrephomene gubernaculifera]